MKKQQIQTKSCFFNIFRSCPGTYAAGRKQQSEKSRKKEQNNKNPRKLTKMPFTNVSKDIRVRGGNPAYHIFFRTPHLPENKICGYALSIMFIKPTWQRTEGSTGHAVCGQFLIIL